MTEAQNANIIHLSIATHVVSNNVNQHLIRNYMKYNEKFDDAYRKAYEKANWSEISRYMRIANQDADDHAAKVCADSAYSLLKRNECLLDSVNVGGVRVEFFVYNLTSTPS